MTASKINRQQLVSRHNIFSCDPKKVFPVGNGEFCFSCDVTGLQTFRGNTMSHWAWHSAPVPEGVTKEMFPATGCYQTSRLTGDGRDTVPEEFKQAGKYMFENPHPVNLGRIRFCLKDPLSNAVYRISSNQITCMERCYDLWNGVVTTKFLLNGMVVETRVCVHPNKDMVAAHVHSDLLTRGVLAVIFDFPYPTSNSCEWAGDFTRDSAHSTQANISEDHCYIRRYADDTEYFCTLGWSSGTLASLGPHGFILIPSRQDTIEFSCVFSLPTKQSSPVTYKRESFDAIQEKCRIRRNRFWQTGGAIDLSGSSDERWFELERRIVLSQALLVVQSAGSLPCAEAGLMNIDAWNGQFHMEMMWWHIAHYALWNRMEFADRQLQCYHTFLPVAKKLSAQLGYKGAKWGKMVGPEGRTAPWEGNLALLWKQPHPIFFAELEYNVRPYKETLEKWAEIIQETATHMADYPILGEDGFYHLDPVMPPCELGYTRDTIFDLAYWKWALDTAQVWRERLGQERILEWDKVSCNLAPLPKLDGVYIRSPEWGKTYRTQNYEHPDMVGVYGMLPPIETVNPRTAHDTLCKVWQTWQKDRIWGWDFPWIAMCATRTGEPEIAVEAMLSGDIDIIGASGMGSYPYLPANGGILFAAAMMAVDRDGQSAPGFPKDGKWTVHAENIIGW